MEKAWHTIPLAEIFAEFGSSREGLSAGRLEENLKKFGRNTLPKEKPYSSIWLFFRQFNNPLIYLLMAATVISFFSGHYSDSIFIIAVLLINTAFGFYQEYQAGKSFLQLKEMVRVRAQALRDGGIKEIDSEGLAAGDVFIIHPGDKIPADGRIIESRNLKINEASLTGESTAVEKSASALLPADAPLPERANMVFMGTIAEEGEARAIVVAGGIDTQIGKIVSALKNTKERATPLQQKIAALSHWVGFSVLAVIAMVIIAGYLTENDVTSVFVASLALAVSAVPEGLLPAITVIMALGMRRIFKRKGLVRKLAATETLGSVTVICTDKTGTLTEGRMQVSHVLTTTRELMGDGIKDLAKGTQANGMESHISALKIATLANDAFVENPASELHDWIVRGNPTDKALLLAGLQAGLSKHALEAQYPIIDRISFDSGNKYAAVLCKTGVFAHALYVIGAPEKILEASSSFDVDGKQVGIDSEKAERLMQKFESLTQKGLRVLACAHKEYKGKIAYASLQDMVKNLVLVGLIAIKDPLRDDAKASIMLARKAGIRTIMVTGDHVLTAKAIAQEIGVEAKEEHIIEGRSLEQMDDGRLKEQALTAVIYARVSPRHKLRIVRALQSNGEVVAMIGDGVNDAPALKAADIGVAVGSGTDVAKETADLVLLDDGFTTVVKAVEQGRIIFDNIRKVFVYLVADNFSGLFLFLASMAMGLPLPLLPAQILWINLVEDGFPNIALTAEQEAKGIMNEMPRNPKEPILNAPLKLWMAIIFLVSGFAAFFTFLAVYGITNDIAKTRTLVFALMCVDSLMFAFSVRSFKQTIFRRDIFSNSYVVCAVLISFLFLLGAVYVPPLQALLGTQPLSAAAWVIVFAITFAEIALIELLKKMIFMPARR